MNNDVAASVVAALLALATSVLRHKLPGSLSESDPRQQVLKDYQSFGGKVVP